MKPWKAALAFVVAGTLSSAVFAEFAAQPLGDDWRCTARPDTQYRPGTVFKVVEGQAPRVEFQLDSTNVPGFNVEKGGAQLGRVRMAASAGGRVTAGLAERVLKLAKATIGIKLEDKDTWDVAYTVSAYNVILGPAVEVARNWVKKHVVDTSPGTSYYLVREAIQASSIDYRMSSGLLAEMGGEVSSKNVLRADALIKDEKTSTYVLTRTLSPPLWVCQLADLLIPQHNIVGGVTWQLSEGAALNLPEPREASDAPSQ